MTANGFEGRALARRSSRARPGRARGPRADSRPCRARRRSGVGERAPGEGRASPSIRRPAHRPATAAAAAGAGNALRVERRSAGSPVLPRADAHVGKTASWSAPGRRGLLDDGVAGAAVAAGDEGMAETPVRGIVQFPPARRADGQVRRIATCIVPAVSLSRIAKTRVPPRRVRSSRDATAVTRSSRAWGGSARGRDAMNAATCSAGPSITSRTTPVRFWIQPPSSAARREPVQRRPEADACTAPSRSYVSRPSATWAQCTRRAGFPRFGKTGGSRGRRRRRGVSRLPRRSQALSSPHEG